jgi:Tol biopolymer transport system component
MAVMIRYALGLGMLLMLVVVGSAPAEPIPEGPRLAYTREGLPLSGEQLLTSDQTGERWNRLLNAPGALGVFEGLTWSPDGNSLAFSDYLGEGVFVISAEGGLPKAVRGTERGFAPVFSPDGKTMAFAQWSGKRNPNGSLVFNASIWLVASQGGRARQLTPWRDEILVPYSFSPDGTGIAAERVRDRTGSEVLFVPLAGGSPSVIVRDGTEPAYSPDGSSLVLVRHTFRHEVAGAIGYTSGGDLFVVASDGSGMRRLTFTPARREESPRWDPSAERLVYTQFPHERAAEENGALAPSSIVEINADGTCRRRLLFTYGLSYREATWRPGPGRGVGRIQC